MLTWRRQIPIQFYASTNFCPLCFLCRLVQKFESKQTWRVSKLMVSEALWCYGANTSKQDWGLCFAADILLLTADSRLENCWSRIPPSWNLFSRRCAEAKFPCCLLELEWKQIQFFPWGLANSILCPSSHLYCLPLPPLLPIQLQYLAPVNSFALANNAQEDHLLTLIHCQSAKLRNRRSQGSTREIYCFSVELPDL